MDSSDHHQEGGMSLALMSFMAIVAFAGIMFLTTVLKKDGSADDHSAGHGSGHGSSKSVNSSSLQKEIKDLKASLSQKDNDLSAMEVEKAAIQKKADFLQNKVDRIIEVTSRTEAQRVIDEPAPLPVEPVQEAPASSSD